MNPRFLSISEKCVEFENGSVVQVQPFSISQSCVSIGWFSDFQKATGYVATAGCDIYMNELVEHLSPKERLDAPAFCTTFADASEFCKWAELRLPTESEWLAAAILDSAIYDSDGTEGIPWFNEYGILNRSKLKDAIIFSQDEWTATVTKDGQVVARSGPQYFRRSDWREDVSMNRRLLRPEEVDLMISFRVCKK